MAKTSSRVKTASLDHPLCSDSGSGRNELGCTSSKASWWI